MPAMSGNTIEPAAAPIAGHCPGDDDGPRRRALDDVCRREPSPLDWGKLRNLPPRAREQIEGAAFDTIAEASSIRVVRRVLNLMTDDGHRCDGHLDTRRCPMSVVTLGDLLPHFTGACCDHGGNLITTVAASHRHARSIRSLPRAHPMTTFGRSHLFECRL
jgi:hypothetical protein